MNLRGSSDVEQEKKEKYLPLVVFLLKRLHVLGNVATNDVLLEDLGVELLGLGVVTRESLLVVGDEDTTVRGTLHGTEDTGTSRSASETYIEVALEGTGLVVTEGLDELEFTSGLNNTLVLVGKAKLGEGSSGNEETGSVTSGPVGETVLDAVSGELLGGGVGEDNVTLDWRQR